MYKNIAIIGPESTGKSWLAQQLAARFQTIWVPEFSREYLANIGRPYELTDVEKIAYGQMLAIENAKRMNPKMMFSDTESLVCKIWAEVVFGRCPDSIAALVKHQNFDFYLLCNVDLPWVADPLREHPNRREEIFLLYKKSLDRLGWPYAIVSGAGNNRLENAVCSLESK